MNKFIKKKFKKFFEEKQYWIPKYNSNRKNAKKQNVLMVKWGDVLRYFRKLMKEMENKIIVPRKCEFCIYDNKPMKSNPIGKKEILMKNFNLNLIAELFIEIYPEDLFIDKPESIIKIREQFKKILSEING